MYFNYDECINFFDDIKGAKDIVDDINQYNSNVKAINLSVSCLSTNIGFVEQEVTKCLNDTVRKYDIFIRMFNFMQANLNPFIPLDKFSFDEKIINLKILTERIPAYICLREHLNDKFKQIFLRLVNISIDDDTIEKAWGSIS